MEFIENYARVEGSDEDDDVDDKMSVAVAGGDEVTCSDQELIDDKTNIRDQDYFLMNVTRDLQEAMQDGFMAEELELVSSDPENFFSNYVDEIEYQYDESSEFEKRIRKFEKDLKIFKEHSKDFFYHALDSLWYILFAVERKRNL